jgi:hypothetical protein
MAYAANSVVVRNAIVKLGGGGRVALYNGGSSNAYVRVEATGFFSPTAPLSFRPVTPQHLKTVSLADGMPKNVDLTGSAGIPASGAKVVLGTLSAIAPSGGGYLTVRPSDESHLYGGYDLGWIHDDTNQVFAQVPAAGTAALTMSSFGSNKQVGIDVFGWFGPR